MECQPGFSEIFLQMGRCKLSCCVFGLRGQQSTSTHFVSFSEPTMMGGGAAVHVEIISFSTIFQIPSLKKASTSHERFIVQTDQISKMKIKIMRSRVSEVKLRIAPGIQFRSVIVYFIAPFSKETYMFGPSSTGTVLLNFQIFSSVLHCVRQLFRTFSAQLHFILQIL